MSIRLFAMVLALSLPAATPAQAIAGEKKAPQVAGEDPNEKVCENITAIGSRLSKKRVCATRAEWADRKLQDRQAVEKAQTSPCMLQSTGANGKPSC
jgi:hypothetical protein